jgi:hypothetical protein
MEEVAGGEAVQLVDLLLGAEGGAELERLFSR